MRRFSVIVGSLALLALLVPSIPVSASTEATTGDLLVALASSHRLPAGDAAAALQSLRAAGYRLPGIDVTARLTERSVTAIGQAMGLNVTTSRPDAPFSKSQVDTFVTTFATEVGSRNGSGKNQTDAADPLEKGKGQKKGLEKSRSEPQ